MQFFYELKNTALFLEKSVKALKPIVQTTLFTPVFVKASFLLHSLCLIHLTKLILNKLRIVLFR